jgi:hypothetical protein
VNERMISVRQQIVFVAMFMLIWAVLCNRLWTLSYVTCLTSCFL